MTLDPMLDFEILEDAREQMHGDLIVDGPLLVGIADQRAALAQMFADLWPMAIDNTIAALGAAVVDDMIARMEEAQP